MKYVIPNTYFTLLIRMSSPQFLINMIKNLSNMVRKKFLVCWILILIAYSFTIYHAISPWLLGAGVWASPIGEDGSLLLRGRNIIDLYASVADRVWESYNQLLEQKPYDPGLFAWGIHYEIRSYCEMYRLTEDRLWIERAVARCDYLYNLRDVNGDGIPSWGNYNATYGNPRYEREGWREFSVWDGVLTTAMIETAQVILDYKILKNNQTLKAKADRYINVVKTVIERYHNAWSDLPDGAGYYWDCPREDVVGPIVNRFSALGISELKLYDVLKDPKYLVKPAAMARLFKKNLRLRGDAYVWTYAVPPSKYTGSIEDISHGAIDLEFAILCYNHGLVFNETDMQRFVATYKKLIWKGFNRRPHLAQRVDGGGTTDYSTASRNWVILSIFDPSVWVYQWTVFNDREPLYSGYYLQAISQLATYYPGDDVVAQIMIREAESVVNNISPLYLPFKCLAELSLDEAKAYYDAGDTANAFASAKKCMSIAENAGIATGSIIVISIFAVVLAVIQVYTSRQGSSVKRSYR